MMLTGQKDLSIDDKGRLVLPSTYRDRFMEGIIHISLSFDNNIVLYPHDSYQKKSARFEALDEFDRVARDLQRVFFANTFDVQIDSHNRVLLPKKLMDKTHTGKKVTLVGMIDHLELWDSEAYAAYEAESEKNYSKNASMLIGK